MLELKYRMPKKNLPRDIGQQAPKDELELKNPVNNSFLYKLYIPDLLADILLIAFGSLVSDQLFSNDGLFYQLPTWQIIAMYCIVVLTLPWYLGYLYERNSNFYSKGFMKLALVVFGLIILTVLIHLIRLVLASDWMTENFSGINAFMAVFAMFLLILGPMMCMAGAASASASLKTEGETEEFELGSTSLTGAFFIIILAIALMIFIIGLFPEDSGFWVVVLGYIGGPIIAVIVFCLFLGFLNWLNKIGIYKYLAKFAKNTFPFFIISVLVFWTGVAIHFMINDFGDAGGKISTSGMLFSVFASGLVPFRIIMLFNAPIRIGNIIIGILSLGYFMFQMILLTK